MRTRLELQCSTRRHAASAYRPSACAMRFWPRMALVTGRWHHRGRWPRNAAPPNGATPPGGGAPTSPS
eukprot:5559209-Lingulodinium_polyedra.AAC.1